jgi:hypothetical protein
MLIPYSPDPAPRQGALILSPLAPRRRNAPALRPAGNDPKLPVEEAESCRSEVMTRTSI